MRQNFSKMATSYKTLKKTPRPTETPPFTLKELKACVPAHCFERSTSKTFFYLAVNSLAAWILYVLSSYIDHPYVPTFASYLLWPIYWICQGCVCTGLWVLAHECGHYAFSDSKTVCDVVGLVLHSALLVPYHSWRISHSKHHRSTNDLDFDEVFVPRTRAEVTEKKARTPSFPISFLHLVKMLLMGWPAYLFMHATGRRYHTHADHFNPKSPLFTRKGFL